VPSTFKRGPVRDHPAACLVEPHLASLVELMVQAAQAGPLHDPDAVARQQAREASMRWTWDAAAAALTQLL
jgi:hypothetical protein